MCTKSGRADECAYDAHSGSLSRHADQLADDPPERLSNDAVHGQVDKSPPPAKQVNGSLQDGSRLGVVEDLQARVERLESLLEQATQNGTAPTPLAVPTVLHAVGETAGGIDIKDGRSKHRAQWNKTSLLNLFDEFKSFIIGKTSSNSSVHLLQQLRQRFPKRALYMKTSFLGLGELENRIAASLPPQEECDRLVEIYFERGENLHRILDRAVFHDQYNQFWSSGPEEQKRNDFAACLLLVTSLASAVDPIQTSCFPQCTCCLIEHWIAGLHGKRAARILSLQVQALFVLQLQAAAAPPDHVWRATGHLNRSAMIAGLHHDPGQILEIPHDVARQRRHLWITIVELDLQASLVCGLPPAPCGKDYTCGASKLSQENKLHEKLAPSLATRLDSAHYTDTASLHRDKVMADLASMERIQEMIEPSNLPAALATMCMHRSILASSRLLFGGPSAHRALSASTNSCLRIIALLKSLQGGEWSVYFHSCGEDIVQAVLIVCLIIRGNNRAQDKTTSNGASSIPDTAKLIKIVRDALDNLVRNIDIEVIGNFMKDLVALAVVIGSVRVHDSSAQHDTMEVDFYAVIGTLLQRAPDGDNQLSRDDKSTFSTPLGSSNGTGDFSLAGQLDLDFGASFDQPYSLDANIFQFDPASEMDTTQIFWPT